MRRGIAALVAGILFSAGLSLAAMTQPSKVLAFLDVFGAWDPTLAVVMVGAIGVSAIGFRIAARRSAPLLGDRFHFRDAKGAIEARLVVGAAVFGVGWGLCGLCPGPAVTLVATGQAGILAFVASMVGGMMAVDLVAATPRAPARA